MTRRRSDAERADREAGDGAAAQHSRRHRAFTAERGYPPSVREIGERVGLSSSSTIHARLKALERRGLISRDPTKPRAMRSAGTTPVPEAIAMPILGQVTAGMPITAQEDLEGEFLLLPALVPKTQRRYAAGARRLDGRGSDSRRRLDPGAAATVAANGEIVVAMVDGEATVKRYYRETGRVRLTAGESRHGANLRERCRDRRPRRSRGAPPVTKPGPAWIRVSQPLSGGPCPSCGTSRIWPSSPHCATRVPWSFIGLAAAFVAILVVQIVEGRARTVRR